MDTTTATITEPNASRCLTPGERQLAESVFGPALDCTRVRLHRAKYWGLQPAWIVMAPDGDLWFHPNGRDWSEDFSAESLPTRAFFVHELTHVWQHQCGCNLIRQRGLMARYDYVLEPDKPFAAYGIEQQAEILRHAYELREGYKRPGLSPLATYAALIPFGAWGIAADAERA